MPRLTPSLPIFHRKIETFCEVRLAPVLAAGDYQNLKSYMLDLVTRQAMPPLHGGRLNWKEIGSTCDLSGPGLQRARCEAKNAFHAIMRWVATANLSRQGAASPRTKPDVAPPAQSVVPSKALIKTPATTTRRSVARQPVLIPMVKSAEQRDRKQMRG